MSTPWIILSGVFVFLDGFLIGRAVARRAETRALRQIRNIYVTAALAEAAAEIELQAMIAHEREHDDE